MTDFTGSMADSMARVARLLFAADAVVALTGAGISAESGLRTFRGATASDLPADMRALWAEFDPMRLATPEAFAADPAMVSRWYDWRRLGCLAAEPNAGHLALADMQRRLGERGGTLTLITQNVDRLHQKAGSMGVVELHGTILEWRCTACARRLTPEREPMPHFPSPAPCCDGALLRPDVVWFGEMLPEQTIAAALRACESADVFLSVGTSAVVQPAASLVHVAARAGAATVEINLDETPASGAVDWSLRGQCGEVLPRLVNLAWR
ncbi:MAG: NAD-dependent deacylase [Phycisphaerales bacterium]